MAYRSDIDGLRAIAVGLVVFFHAHLAGCTGGYIGVDVFFVISGFLITGIISSDLEKDRFSFLNFYERRIRRIFPVLFLVLCLVCIGSFVLMVPEQFPYFARGVFGSGLFGTNYIVFRSAQDYFAPNSSENPLLHLWSLSIEEQFYLFYPALLVILWSRSRRYLIKALCLIATASLVAAEWKSRQYLPAAFYLAQYRIWELLLGGILSQLPQRKLDKASGNATALSGLALVLGAGFLYNEKTRFPALAALPPVVGTMLLLYAGSSMTLVSRLLTTKPAVWLGKRSYGLYLWHWPVFALTGMVYPGELRLHHRLILVAVSLVLAESSYRWIELPFGNKGLSLSRRTVFATAFSLIAVSVTFGALSWTKAGLVAQWQARGDTHVPFDWEKDVEVERVTQEGPKVLLWGDSFAHVLAEPFSKSLKKRNQNAAVLIHRGCPPLPNLTVDVALHSEDDPCTYDKELQQVLNDPAIKVVVLFAYWEKYIVGKFPARFRASENMLCGQNGCPTTFAEREAMFLTSAKEAIRALQAKGKRVVILGPVPGPGFSIARAAKFSKLFNIAFPKLARKDLGEGFWQTEKTLETLGHETGVTVKYPSTVLCGETCTIEREGEILYIDNQHLNAAGSAQMWEDLKMNDLVLPVRNVATDSE